MRSLRWKSVCGVALAAASLGLASSPATGAVVNRAVVDTKVAGPMIVVRDAVADAKVAGSYPEVIIEPAVADAKVAGSHPEVIIEPAVADTKSAGPAVSVRNTSSAKASTAGGRVRRILNLNAPKSVR